MKFVWVTMHVCDLEKTQGFYEDFLGLQVNRKIKAGEDMEIVFLGDGDTQIELIYQHNSDKQVFSSDTSLGFAVDSVDDTLKKAHDMDIKVVSGIIEPNPHIKFFYVLDPNGAKIQLVERM